MPTNRDEIKAICAMPMTGTAKLVAIAIVTFKTLDTNELAAITGESARTVQKARATYLELKDEPREPEFAERGETRESGEPEFAKDAKDANYNSPLAPASHARIETPTGLLSTEEKKKETSLSEVPSDQCAKPKKVAKASRRFAYSDEFEAFWQAYPDRSNNSKPNAHREWLLLLPAERELAAQGLTHLAAHCRKNPDYRCVHAERYLKTRRWESYDMRPKVVPIRQPAPPPMSDEEVFRLANSRSWQ